MKTFSDESIDCILTSPPYWQLRDYGVSRQLGHEATIEEYIRELCRVFDEAKRVLKSAGTCWINMGDGYGSPGMRYKGIQSGLDTKKPRSQKPAAANRLRLVRAPVGLPEKSLAMVPFRFALEMVRRGWILRNVIIWHKPNCLPSSAKDRFTVDFEYLFFFVKSKRYYFQRQFQPHNPSTQKRVQSFRNRKERFDPARHKHAPGNFRDSPFAILERICKRGLNPQGRNKRCVWTVAVRGFRGNHFATFPQELAETPIRAGCTVEGVVCDPFFGSGTTGLVARRLKCHFVGIELNPDYVMMARQRIAADSGEKYD